MKDALGEVQSILVLGGNSEIGKAIAEKLVANRNARVRLAVRTAPGQGEQNDTQREQAAAYRSAEEHRERALLWLHAGRVRGV